MIVIEIIRILLPIATALTIGMCSRKFGVIERKSFEQIKKLIFDLILPVTLFNTFLNANYSMKSFIYIFSAFIAFMTIYFLATFVGTNIIKTKNKYFPEMLTTWEGGTIGISLCALLCGDFGVQQMAILDFGHALFLFIFMVSILKIKDGGRIKSKDIMKLIFSSKPLIGIMLGAICGASGIGSFVNENIALNAIYHGIIDIIIVPVNFLILFVVGYMINIKKETIRNIITLCLFRLLFLGIGCFISCFIIFHLIPFDKKIFSILLIAFSLPPTYALGVFTSFGGDVKAQELYSDVVSFSTIITLVLYVIISMYYLGNL